MWDPRWRIITSDVSGTDSQNSLGSAGVAQNLKPQTLHPEPWLPPGSKDCLLNWSDVMSGGCVKGPLKLGAPVVPFFPFFTLGSPY